MNICTNFGHKKSKYFCFDYILTMNVYPAIVVLYIRLFFPIRSPTFRRERYRKNHATKMIWFLFYYLFSWTLYFVYFLLCAFDIFLSHYFALADLECGVGERLPPSLKSTGGLFFARYLRFTAKKRVKSTKKR